jgi:nicotinate-nucleotide--dimethylbenzimidazole phosphoribosyltransferase
MKHFRIHAPEEKIKGELQHKIDNLTKPKGSLGRLEELAMQVGLIQQTLSPELNKPHNVIFAADHGITEENISVSPKEVTRQQCTHFLKSNGGGINFLCRQHGFALQVVDAGVDCDFPPDIGIIDMKVRKGTRNYVREAAMTTDEMELCIANGAAVVRNINATGCNVVSFGEMGIGNTSSSSLWMTCLTNIPLLQCVGAGSGLSAEGVRYKYQVLKKALDNYCGDRSVEDVMRYFGGYEMVAAVGAMLQAAELKMIILVDGFIMTNCILAASHLYPEVLSYAVFGHCGDESGHVLLLEALKARPLLNLGMRLGEGTGAVCAYPILDSAVRMINEMDSFEGGKVTKYF